jgi:hypothetical protein
MGASLERVEAEDDSHRLVSGALIPGERIQDYLAKPDGAGRLRLHGCAAAELGIQINVEFAHGVRARCGSRTRR